MSRIGFGALRSTLGNIEHESSLRFALLNGINVIDTSPNYGHGSSERLIAKVLKDVESQLPNGRQGINLMTKFGFYGGLGAHDADFEWNNSVLADERTGVKHCLDPDFMRAQLDGSLQRLETDYIDTYWVHSPECFLIPSLPPPPTEENPPVMKKDQPKQPNGAPPSDGAIANGQPDREVRLSQLMDRLLSVFEALEGEVADGRIKSYGVSSYTFSRQWSDPLFFPYHHLPALAHRAALSVGHSRSSLGGVQLPLNLLETAALKEALPWAAQNGLRSYITRPLSALAEDGSAMQLCSFMQVDSEGAAAYVPPQLVAQRYAAVRDAATEHFTPPPPSPDDELSADERAEVEEACGFLRALIRDMDREVTAFSSPAHFDADLQQTILPALFGKVEEFDPTSAAQIHGFLSAYAQMVRVVCAQRARDVLAQPQLPLGPHSPSDDQPLQDYAMRWVMAQPGVDCVLLGMTQPYQAAAAAEWAHCKAACSGDNDEQVITGTK